MGEEQRPDIKMKKEIEKLKTKYPNIGKNEYFISRWGYTLEFKEAL